MKVSIIAGKSIGLALALLLMNSCTTTREVQIEYIDTACDWVEPITLTAEEVDLVRKGIITLQTAKSLLAHNRAWKMYCGGPVAKSGSDPPANK